MGRRSSISLRIITTLTVGLIVVSAGCSSGHSSRATSGTTGTTDTTVGTGTSAGTASTSTSSPATATTTTLGPPPAPGTIPFIAPSKAPSDGVSPAGSGCTPPSLTKLPDGEWFGFLRSVDVPAGRIGLDLECLFWGAAANAAARADGSTDIPVPNDHYERNRSPLVYREPTVPNVAVSVLGAGGSATTRYPTAYRLGAAGVLVGQEVWIQITQGWVVAIQQQYFP
jgi:hypothetical protein